MKKLFTIIFFLLSVLFVYGQEVNGDKIKANYDERVELMSIICHLAGYHEYNMNNGGNYIEDIDHYFASVKNHPAVQMMDSLRNSNGISYDSPMSFAINLNKIDNNFIIVNDSIVPEKRWEGVDLKKTTAIINDFYKKSNFSKFFNSHKLFYERICSIFDTNVISKFNQNWYEQFYGVKTTDKFEVIIGFTNGGGNYGPSCQLPGQQRNVYAIIGYSLDDNGEPYYSTEPEMYLNTLIHEFNHSFVNPLSDNQKFNNIIIQAGNALMPYCKKLMRKNAYSKWKIIVNESIVRAAVINYLIDNNISNDKIKESVKNEMSVGFYWIPELVTCLQYYTQHRNVYPTIDSYYPNIITFFNNYANNCSQKIDSIFK